MVLLTLVAIVAVLAALTIVGRGLESSVRATPPSATISAGGPTATGAPTAAGPSPSPTPNARLLTPSELWSELDRLGSAGTTGGPVTLTSRALGPLVLPSGRVVAGDAFMLTGAPAFSRVLAPGDYVVSIVLASSATDARVAAAILRAAGGAPVRWQLATVPGQDAVSLAPDEFLGYAVDSGTGAFTSPEAARLIPTPSDPAQDPIVQQLGQNEVPTWTTANVVLDEATGANLIAFSSGFGDGDYPSYWGLDAAGRPVVLVTDFGVLDAPIGGSPPAPSP